MIGLLFRVRSRLSLLWAWLFHGLPAGTRVSYVAHVPRACLIGDLVVFPRTYPGSVEVAGENLKSVRVVFWAPPCGYEIDAADPIAVQVVLPRRMLPPALMVKCYVDEENGLQRHWVVGLNCVLVERPAGLSEGPVRL